MKVVRLPAVALVAVALAFACERSDPAAPRLLANLAKTGGLLPCKPLGYDSATQKFNLYNPQGSSIQLTWTQVTQSFSGFWQLQ